MWKKVKEPILLFGFDFLGNRLVPCIENLYTHMPTSFISIEAARQMIVLVRSLKLFGELLKRTVAEGGGLREALNGLVDTNKTGGIISLHACRMSVLEMLKHLQKTLCFPEFKEDYEIRSFCLTNACSIFCTASCSISLHIEGNNNLEFVVIDEAAQLKECESLIPLQLRGLCNAILIGDERQLPAMVQSKICEEADFGRSLFELARVTPRNSVQRMLGPDLSSSKISEDLSNSLAGSNIYAFSLAELTVITQSFSSSNLLGEGGFGPVHKGFIDDKLRPGLKAQPVAVKRLNLEVAFGTQTE